MIEVPWWGYLAGFILAGTLSWLLTPVTRWVAVYLEIFDHPGDYKQQSDPVPYLGGLAIVAAYTLVVSLVTIVIPDLPGREPAIMLGLAFGGQAWCWRYPWGGGTMTRQVSAYRSSHGEIRRDRNGVAARRADPRGRCHRAIRTRRHRRFVSPSR